MEMNRRLDPPDCVCVTLFGSLGGVARSTSSKGGQVVNCIGDPRPPLNLRS